jgi:hypothetical protein
MSRSDHPDNGALSRAIDAHISIEREQKRDYIGASSIGSDCLRQIWYEYKVFKGSFDPRIVRIFEVGKRLEGLVVDWLFNAGFKVSEQQHPFFDAELPYFQGHCDGILETPHAILEIKTAKDASFKQFVKHGLKKWMPRYYDQIQAYLGMSGLINAYILVLNKDNSDLFDEKVVFDAGRYIALKEKARLIHDAKVEPPRINSNPAWFQCKTCRFRKICHELPEK